MAPLQMTLHEKLEKIWNMGVLFSIAGLGVFLVYAVAGDGSPHVAMSPDNGNELVSSRPKETEKEKIAENAATAENSSNIRQELLATQDQSPAKRIDLPSLETLRASVATAKKPAANTIYAEVQRYDRCLPYCDTRDPLIANRPETERIPQMDTSQSEVSAVPETEPLSVAHSGREFLGYVAEAPATTLKKGKQVFQFAADLLR
ncbi:hypothetical protein ACO34A_26970 (plasmid) [Rhizobium sp. ACO-34A]|nr:hypothetical protein [Rhizobium sp. ACO-34A]ATN37413.1 hypothetical protein ACO34A_26970 [Rhizobium sp. ACO-34A]